MLNLILVWCCRRSIGDKFAARDGEPSTTGVDMATTNFSTLISFTEPAFFGLLLRMRGSTECVSGHSNIAGLVSCFVIATLAQSGAEADLTCLPWHMDLVGLTASPTSLAEGCLEENDDVQSMAGRTLDRLLRTNGRDKEPRVRSASRS